MADSIFTKIVKGEIPCHKVYEDAQTLAFLDIHPVQPGHTLVVPKVEIASLWELDDATYQALMSATKKVAQRCQEVLGVPYVGLQVIGIDVPHAHVHVIPFTTVQQYRMHPDMTAEPDHTALADMAQRLAL